MLIQKIADDIKEALKAQNAEKVSALRFILAALQARQKELSGGGQEELSDEEAVKILQREAKKRKEAIALYDAGGRGDLSEKEKFELSLLKNYLPEELSAQALSAIVSEVLKSGAKEFPAAMKEVMARVQGKADGKTVSALIKEKLQVK